MFCVNVGRDEARAIRVQTGQGGGEAKEQGTVGPSGFPA